MYKSSFFLKCLQLHDAQTKRLDQRLSAREQYVSVTSSVLDVALLVSERSDVEDSQKFDLSSSRSKTPISYVSGSVEYSIKSDLPSVRFAGV